jgi:DNA-binding transcriptional MerR regulator
VDSQARTSGHCDSERCAPVEDARDEKGSPGAKPECDSIPSSIRDLAGEFGVSARTLLFYEERGLLKPQRDGTSRYYGPKDRLRLKMILHGKQLGFSLPEIRAILDGERNASGERSAAGSGAGSLHPDGTNYDGPALAAGCGQSLPVAQLAAQIDHLERQRKELDDAILFLRNARRRLDEAGRPTGSS